MIAFWWYVNVYLNMDVQARGVEGGWMDGGILFLLAQVGLLRLCCRQRDGVQGIKVPYHC